MFKFANFFVTELTQVVSSGNDTLVIPVSASERLPEIVADSGHEARLILWNGQQDPEIVGCVVNDFSGQLTVTRGEEGTTARQWPAGTQVVSALTAEVINEALAAIVDVTTVGDVRYLLLTGGTLSGDLELPVNADPDDAHAIRRDYLDSVIAGFLQSSGFTMVGTVNMNSNRIINLPTPLAAAEPMPKGYTEGLLDIIQDQIDDQEGSLSTGGSSTAYTVTSNQAGLTLVDGLTISLRLHTTSGANPTLQVNSLTAKPIRVAAATPLPLGAGIAGQPYTLTYSSAEDAWLIHAVLDGIRGVPGVIDEWGGDVAPTGAYLCYGQTASRTTDARLFGIIGTKWGVGDGSTTFNLPDRRGKSPIGNDAMGGSAANRSQVSTNLTTTSGNASATVASATGLFRGMYIVAAGVTAGTTISSISGTTITMSAVATASATVAARFSPIADAQVVGSTGGALSNTMHSDQMPSHLHTQTAQQPTFTFGKSSIQDAGTGSVKQYVDNIAGTGLGSGSVTTNDDATPGNTGSTGGGQPMNNLSMVDVVNYIIWR